MKMRRLTFTIILVCGGLLPSMVLGQQNLFNVPSSNITEPGEIFFQQQFNALPGLLQINTTLCYGLGRNMEVGFNIIGLNVNTRSSSPFIISNGDISNPPVYPFYTLNLQKAFVLNKVLRLAIGTQTGLSIDAHFGNYTYTNLVSSIPKWHSKIVTGIYASTNSFLAREIATCSCRRPAPLDFNLASNSPSSGKSYTSSWKVFQADIPSAQPRWGGLGIFQSIGYYHWAISLQIPAAWPSTHSSRSSRTFLPLEVTGKCWGM